jgi:hypothetical protein
VAVSGDLDNAIEPIEAMITATKLTVIWNWRNLQTESCTFLYISVRQFTKPLVSSSVARQQQIKWISQQNRQQNDVVAVVHYCGTISMHEKTKVLHI